MEVKTTKQAKGSLQISTHVLAKIAKFAALEVDGVAGVSTGITGIQGVFTKTSIQKPVFVEMHDGLAIVNMHLVMEYGATMRTVAAAVQSNVKNAIQSMTGITVLRVNIVVAGAKIENASTVNE